MGTKRQNLPQAVMESLISRGSECSLNERSRGVWRPVNSATIVSTIRSIAAGLRSLGLVPGQCVGIFAPSSPYWLYADLGTQLAGGITVPIFDTICDEHLAFQIKDSAMRFAFCDGQEAWNRLTPFLSHFERVIVRNVSVEGSAHAIKYRHFISLASHSDTGISEYNSSASHEDMATIVYTSGSTGTPKGVELTQGNLLSQIEGAGQRFPLDPETDRAMSGLPLAHVFERMVVYYYLISAVDLYFVDEISNIATCLREVKATTMTMVPRLLEKLYARFLEKSSEAPFPRKQIARWAMTRASYQSIDRNPGLADSVAHRLVYHKFLDAIGGNFRRVIVGGAPLAPRLQRFFINIGLPIYVGYGLTESSPVLSVNYPRQNRIGTVGPIYPKVMLKISHENEILAKGPNIMRGYHNNSAATERAIDPDGWLHTGDLGSIDEDGFLRIQGRAKELLKTSNGKYVTPIPIEQSLCHSPLIDIAMVVAEGKPFVCCILFLDTSCLNKMNSRPTLENPSQNGILEDANLQATIQRTINETNTTLDEWERIRDFRCVLDPPSITAGEITPTMKLKRNVVETKYRPLIDAMYSDHDNTQFNPKT